LSAAARRETPRRSASEPEKEPEKKCGGNPATKDLSESREDGIIVERQVEYDDLVQYALMLEDEKEKLEAKFSSLQSSEGSAVDDGSSDCMYQLTEQSDDDHKKEYRGRQFDLADDKRKALEQSLLATETAISATKGGIATIKEDIATLKAGIVALDEYESVAEATEQGEQEREEWSELIVERQVEYDNFVRYTMKLEEEKARLEANLSSRQSSAKSAVDDGGSDCMRQDVNEGMEIVCPVMQFDRNITDGRVMRRVAKLHGDPAIVSSPTGCTAITQLRAVRRAARRPRR